MVCGVQLPSLEKKKRMTVSESWRVISLVAMPGVNGKLISEVVPVGPGSGSLGGKGGLGGGLCLEQQKPEPPAWVGIGRKENLVSGKTKG